MEPRSPLPFTSTPIRGSALMRQQGTARNLPEPDKAYRYSPSTRAVVVTARCLGGRAGRKLWACADGDGAPSWRGTQIKLIFGFHVPRDGSALDTLRYLVNHLRETQPLELALGCTWITILMGMKHLGRKHRRAAAAGPQRAVMGANMQSIATV